jgi:TDG/mug DNA glycosylase family protein
VTFLGLSAYRTAFDVPDAVTGPRPERIVTASVWVLPNPSGANAHYQLPALATEFGRLREAAVRA